MKPSFFAVCHPKKSQVLLPLEKNRVDFTGYPSNHFPGGKLNRQMTKSTSGCTLSCRLTMAVSFCLLLNIGLILELPSKMLWFSEISFCIKSCYLSQTTCAKAKPHNIRDPYFERKNVTIYNSDIDEGKTIN